MARKSNAQKAAEEAAKAAAADKQDKSGGDDAQADTAVKETAIRATGAASASVAQRNRLILQNTSRNIQIIPLDKDRQRRLLPNESWEVEDGNLEAVRNFMKTPYFASLADLGHYKARDVQPSRLGEQELAAPETPEPPEDLTKIPESVTQAEFVKDSKGE